MTLIKPKLLRLLATGEPDGIGMDGDASDLGGLLSLTDQTNPDAAIVAR